MTITEVAKEPHYNSCFMKRKWEVLTAFSPVILLFIAFAAFLFSGGNSVIMIFLAVAAYSVIISGGSIKERIDTFSSGAADKNIMYMIWIFILAGAFGAVAKAIGAVDSTVAATLSLIPPRSLPAGIFIAACIISMSIGTSVGTIVVMIPIAMGFAQQLSEPAGWFVAIVVGGAFFGDNLSFISDTTVAATRTQGCGMKEKFKTNFFLVLPAAITSILLYLFFGNGMATTTEIPDFRWIRIVPYALVIILMFSGMDVISMLSSVLLVTAAIGFYQGDFGVAELCSTVKDGVVGMAELIVVTMLAGGILGVVKRKGGFDYALSAMVKRIKSSRGAEFAIAGMTAFANLCTANNTIAILTTGEIAKEIASRYSIQPKRAASIMDTASCFVQGVIPYGAQLLIASQMSGVAAGYIIPNLYYPILIGVMVVLSILTNNHFQKKVK